MRKLFIILSMLIATIAINPSLLLAHPPPHAKAHGVKKKTYYYYPGINVYFDVHTKYYIVFKSGKWVRVQTLPRGIVLTPSSRVIIYYPGNDIFIHNKAHTVKYGKHPHHKPVKHQGNNYWKPKPGKGKPK